MQKVAIEKNLTCRHLALQFTAVRHFCRSGGRGGRALQLHGLRSPQCRQAVTVSDNKKLPAKRPKSAKRVWVQLLPAPSARLRKI